MRLTCTSDPIDCLPVDTISVSFFSDERPLRGSAGLIDWRLCGAVSRTILEGRLEGAFGERLLIHTSNRLPASRVLVTGTGPLSEYGYDKLDQVLAGITNSLKGVKVPSIAMTLPGVALSGLDYASAAQRLVDAFSHLRSSADWMSELAIYLVIHESRLSEVSSKLTKSLKGCSWIRLGGRKFR